MKKAQMYNVFGASSRIGSLDISRKVWSRSWISKRNCECPFFPVFQELMKESSDRFKGLL